VLSYTAAGWTRRSSGCVRGAGHTIDRLKAVGTRSRRADRGPSTSSTRRLRDTLRVAEASHGSAHPSRRHARHRGQRRRRLYALPGQGRQATRHARDPDHGKAWPAAILPAARRDGQVAAATTPSSPPRKGLTPATTRRARDRRLGGLCRPGLREESPRVGQRKVILNRAGAELRRMIDTGELPSGMKLPRG